MNEFLYEHQSLVTKFFELIAAISGSWYLHKTKNEKIKIFVYYLWLTVIVEVLGVYTKVLQNNYDYEWFITLKNSIFCRNSWLYNIYTFLSIGLLGIFYSDLLISRAYKIIVRSVFLIYCFFALGYYMFTDAFFSMGLPFDDILGTVIITIYVICYFIELIRSEFILQYYKMPSFYISIALLLWHLCVTPLFIFNSYFRAVNAEFVTFRTFFLLYFNIFTYSFLTFGFWYSLYKNKQ